MEQLTYAAVKRSGDRSGGWGVVEATAGLTEDRRIAMQSGVVTRIDELTPTDEFAKREALDARVRCLSYAPDGHWGIWWHAVVAGKDASGRPGNVFTHACSAPLEGLDYRPVDLWRSPDWLTPFGVTAVAESTLPSDIGPMRAAEAALTWVLHQPPELVEPLLSAVVHCFADDRPLVLAVGSTDEFIDWMRAICSLTSASVAAQIPFSTFVRAESLPSRPRRFEILGMPREDLEGLSQGQSGENPWLVLDLSQPPQRDSDECWVQRGQRWNAGERWAAAYSVLAEGTDQSIADMARLMDELTVGVLPRDQLSPDWPLVLAIIRHGSAPPDWGMFVTEWNTHAPFRGITDSVLIERLENWPPPNQAIAPMRGSLERELPYETEREDVTGTQGVDESWRKLWIGFPVGPDFLPIDMPPLPLRDMVHKALSDLEAAADTDEQRFLRDFTLHIMWIPRVRLARRADLDRVETLLRAPEQDPRLVTILTQWRTEYNELANAVAHGGKG